MDIGFIVFISFIMEKNPAKKYIFFKQAADESNPGPQDGPLKEFLLLIRNKWVIINKGQLNPKFPLLPGKILILGGFSYFSEFPNIRSSRSCTDMSAGQEVRIAVDGRREYKGETEENYSFSAIGKGYLKDGAIYLIYEEVLEGIEGTTTTIKLIDDRVEIIRGGALRFKQVFAEGEHKKGMYRTPYGNLPCEWVTEKIVRVEEAGEKDSFPSKGKIRLIYLFRFQDDEWSKLRIKISYEVSKG